MHKRKQQFEATISPVQGNLDVSSTRPNLQASTETNVNQFEPSNFQVQNHVDEDNSINIVSPFHADWNGSEVPEEQKPYPDINMSAPDE